MSLLNLDYKSVNYNERYGPRKANRNAPITDSEKIWQPVKHKIRGNDNQLTNDFTLKVTRRVCEE